MVQQARASGMRWEIPSGGQESGETLEEAAVREVFEETGVKAFVGPLIATFSSYRPRQSAVVMGAIYAGTVSDFSDDLTPQLADGIVEAAFVDPLQLPRRELGALTTAILRRWWPQRDRQFSPWHVELCRDTHGYRGVDSATTELRPIQL
jgi:8-oxo-dGTP pyrophosphatase MutT (NUDIX family)